MLKRMPSIVTVLGLSIIIQSAWAQVIARVDQSTDGMQDNSYSDSPILSADGQFVAFRSASNNLVTGDTNGKSDIFVHNHDTGLTERVNLSSAGVQANNHSFAPSLSADGSFVVFNSQANNLVPNDTNFTHDIFIHNRSTGLTERVSVSSTGVQAMNHSFTPSISADGRLVAFMSWADNLVANDTNFKDIFVHDRETGHTELVSVSSTGEQSNRDSFEPSISANGQFVVFGSYANNLVADDTNDRSDIFIHDRETGVTERINAISTAGQANSAYLSPSLSADGQLVVFISRAHNLVDGDSNSAWDVFVYDRETGVTERISVSSTGEQSNNDSFHFSLSATGRFVAFRSIASNLVADDTNNVFDIFAHDRDTGMTERINLSSTGEQSIDRARDLSYRTRTLSIDANGHFVTFSSDADNLVANDTNFRRGIFVAKNSLIDYSEDFKVTLRPNSGATQVGEYIRFRARLANNSDTTLTNCKALLVNPLINDRREFNYSSWPLKVANPVINGVIDIAPGETGQFNLAVLPRVAMRREVRFEYVCDNTKALPIPFISSVHLTAKTEPLIAQDFVQLKNSNNRSHLEIDRSNGKYWTAFTLKVENAGNESTSVNLTTKSNLTTKILRKSLCEPIDPASGNWTCINPRNTQLMVELAPNESKKILVYLHARATIVKRVMQNRIYLEARDAAGEVVSKTSMGISTIN